MATQTWMAERDKLMASNPSLSLIDATKQARGMTTSTTPVAPVTTPAPTTSPSVPASPTPAPVPTATPTATPTTTQTTPTSTISTAKAGDTVVGVNGEVFTQANNQDFSTTPTETPKVVSATPMSKADEIKAKNEAQLAINQQKAQQAQAERDKATTEQNKVLSNNSLAILNTLKTGGVVPEEVKTSPNYKIALDTYNKIQKYSTYSVNDIATALNQGAILPGTTVYNEMLKDPAMKQKLTDAQIFRNNTPVDSNKVFENASSDILANNPITASMLDDGIITAEEYAQATNTAEVVAAAKQKEEKTIKYNTLKAEFDAIADEVEAQFPGGAYNDAIIADRQRAKLKELNIAQGELDAVTGTLTELKAQSSALFEANLNLQQEELAQKRARENAIFAQQIQDGDINSTDPYIREVGIRNAVTRIIGDIPTTIPLEQHIANAVASNNPQAYLAQLTKDIQGKDLYKAKQAYMMNQYAPKTEDTKPFQVGDKTYQYNPSTQQYEIINGTGGGALPSSFTGDTTSYIASKEGFRDTAYQDSAGVWTIGYGTTKINGKPVQPGQKITQAEAQKLLNEDIARHSNWKNYIDESTLSDSQKTALASFEYNLGPGIWDKSAMNIIDMVKSGDLAGAGKEMQKYVNAGGKRVQGLANRRAEEAQLLMNTAKGTGSEDIKMQALSLVQGLGGTADERRAFADNVIKVAQRDNISLAEAKKKLGYKSADDVDFAKTRKEDIQSLKKDTRDKLSNANTALTLLNQPQTAIGDVASVVGFLKTIDPASVARESEVASVENARGILDSLSNVFAKAKEGTKLTDTQREQLKQSIKTIVDAGNNKYYEAIYNTSQEFNDRGLDPTVYISKNDVTKANQIFGGIRQSSTPENQIMQVVNSLIPTAFQKYFTQK